MRASARRASVRLEMLGLTVLALCAASCARAADPTTLRIATWNLEWFFDADHRDNYSDLGRQQSAPRDADWQWKLEHVARVIAEIEPDILAVQEVENRRVLQKLAEHLGQRHRLRYRVAFIEGGDVSTEQDVGLLYRGDLLSYSRREQTAEMFNSREFYNVQKHLFAEFHFAEAGDEQRLLLVTAHLRAGAEDEQERRRQARLLHTWVADDVQAQRNVIMLGDFNSDVDPSNASGQSDLGNLRGLHTSAREDDLLDLQARVPQREQSTHITGRRLDRILISPALHDDASGQTDWVFRSAEVRRDLVVRGRGPDRNHAEDFWQIPERERDVSDHYPVVAEFELR